MKLCYHDSMRISSCYLYKYFTWLLGEQQYPTLSQVAISTSVAENVVRSGKALATSSVTLWTTSLFAVTLYHTLP